MNIDSLRKLFDLVLEYIIIGGWLWMIQTGKAEMGSFIVIATYIIKKKYDMKDEIFKNGKYNQPTIEEVKK